MINLFDLGFRIPANIDLRRKWIAAIKRKNWTPSDKTFICSEHFKLTDYLVLPGNSWLKLKPEAVPSKFDFSSHMCKPSPKKRLLRNSIGSSSNVNINVTEIHKHDDADCFGSCLTISHMCLPCLPGGGWASPCVLWSRVIGLMVVLLKFFFMVGMVLLMEC